MVRPMPFPPLLLIPGPVTTHPDVRAAAAQDYAPWDNEFRALVVRVRQRLLTIAAAGSDEHIVLPLQGCGHFGMEAAIRSFLPPGGKLLVPATGSYAERIVRLAHEAGRVPVALPVPAGTRAEPAQVREALRADPTISHLALVYSETSTGIVHDAPALARAAGELDRRVLIDAVSAFGAFPLDLAALPMVDAAVFTSNKCLEGLPGLVLIAARIDRLEAGKGAAGSWSFDLADIAQTALRAPGAFRFTPPAQTLAALDVALGLFEREGRAARLARYSANMREMVTGVRALGLRPCLPTDVQGPVILNVHAPSDPIWNLQRFVDALKARGVVISNFHNTPFPSFRVGCIGAIGVNDIRRAVAAMGDALDELGVRDRRAA